MKLSSGTLLWGGFWWFGPVLNIVSGRIVPYLPAGLGAQYPAWTASYEVCLAASALGFGWLARRLDWASLRWLSVTCWVALIPATVGVLAPLYGSRIMPDDVQWISWAVLLAAGEYLMLSWQANEWPMRRNPLAILHALRTAGPWLAIWPAGAILVSDWLRGPAAQQSLMAQAGWAISASWSNYLPTWAMIVVLGWLVRRSRQEKWPTTPLADWYRSLVLPIGAMFLVLLVTIWNFTQDGTMAPLPYLPVLNPLDLTTGFVLLLGIAVARLQGPGEPGRMSRIGLAAAGSCYLWFNLVLLRSAAQYLDIAYAFEPLMASQFVQAMLSLVWTSTALVLMRHAATRLRRRQWGVGAALLGIVVAKLILADLKNGGSMARVISFVGVGLLMVLIGYFAPYPKAAEHEAVGAGTNQ
jgi:uncharacterized membrane protein